MFDAQTIGPKHESGNNMVYHSCPINFLKITTRHPSRDIEKSGVTQTDSQRQQGQRASTS